MAGKSVSRSGSKYSVRRSQLAYADDLKDHLVRYKQQTLRIAENGVWRENEYEHILPVEHRFLNILETFRQEFQERVASGQVSFNLEDLPHLNSSQAMGINLFLPFHKSRNYSAFLAALELDEESIQEAHFEHVMGEQTNVDILLHGESGHRVFIEIKLKETEFGSAGSITADYQGIFNERRPQLESVIQEKYLTLETFKKHYQLLRYLAFLSGKSSDTFCLLVPRRNEQFKKEIAILDAMVLDDKKDNVKVVYLEDVVDQLINSLRDDELLHRHFVLFKEKYIAF
jgi:hypothetical protein